MNLFHLLSMTAPLLVGLILPFIISLGCHRRQRYLSMIKTGAIFTGIVIGILLGVAVMSGAAMGVWLNLALYLVVFSVLVVSVMQLMLLSRMGPTVAQILTSMVVILMMGTVFYFNPIIDAVSLDRKQFYVDLGIGTNPWIVIGGSILGTDPLHAPWLYHVSRIGEFLFMYPPWTDVVWMFFAISVVLWFPRMGWWIWKRTSHGGQPLQQTGPV